MPARYLAEIASPSIAENFSNFFCNLPMISSALEETVLKTVLLIDSDPTYFKILEDKLRKEGFEFFITDRRQEAIALVQREKPGLILLEVLLADCNGFELLREIRELSKDSTQIPVVLLTQCQRTARAYSQALELDVKDFLTKPVPDAQLLSLVREQTVERSETPRTDPTQAAPEAGAKNPLAGSFSKIPFPSLLHQLHKLGATGVLVVSNEKERVGIQFRNGSPVAIRSDKGFEPIENYLARTRRITEQERTEVIERAKQQECMTTSILLETNAIAREELEKVYSEQAEECLLKIFAWPAGNYQFHKNRTLNPADSMEIASTTPALILRGVLHHYPLARIDQVLRSTANFYVVEAERSHYSVEESGLSPLQREFLTSQIGDQSVGSFLNADELRRKTLYGLVITEFLEYQTNPVMVLRDEVSTKTAPQVSIPAQEEAAPEIIPKAALGELRDAVGADQSHANHAERALRSEEWFRKGNGLLNLKQYQKAVEAFGMAAHLDPEEGEYLAHLGYALFLSNPTDGLVQREAQEHLAKGIKLSPNREISYLFLGRIYKSVGETEVARKMFRRALQIKPEYYAALQELRVLNLRDEKELNKGGLLGRFLKK